MAAHASWHGSSCLLQIRTQPHPASPPNTHHAPPSHPPTVVFPRCVNCAQGSLVLETLGLSPGSSLENVGALAAFYVACVLVAFCLYALSMRRRVAHSGLGGAGSGAGAMQPVLKAGGKLV